jgi:hypothetical protein
VAPFLAPAAPHVACGFPAPRAPAHFMSRLRWLIQLVRLPRRTGHTTHGTPKRAPMSRITVGIRFGHGDGLNRLELVWRQSLPESVKAAFLTLSRNEEVRPRSRSLQCEVVMSARAGFSSTPTCSTVSALPRASPRATARCWLACTSSQLRPS